MHRIFRAGARRATALVQLLLFAFSASTSLLPCGDARLSGGARVSAEMPAVHATTADVLDESSAAMHHHAHGASGAAEATTHETAPLSHHHERSHDTTCPWVIGCLGMAQLALDNELRVVERVEISAAPSGVIMRRMITDREIESPPPRI